MSQHTPHSRSSSSPSAQGTFLLHAVERILEHPDALERRVEQLRLDAAGDRAEASRRIISWYSNRSALAGAVAAAPAVVPGWGTLGILGTLSAEMVYVLKLEVELCLALCALDERPIRDPLVRQLAFGLAAVAVHHVATGRNALRDAGAVGMQALFRYTPRELGKVVAQVVGRLAIAGASRSIGKGLLRAIPIVGIGIGAAANKLLTQSVGRAAFEALSMERAYRHASAPTDA